MYYDEQHGWVERGTPGVHGGAVVEDVAYEVAILEGFARTMRLHIEYDVLHASCQERHDHHIWLMGRMESQGDRRFHAAHAARLKLAMLTPYVTMMRATTAHREAQQARRHVIRVRMDVMLPARVETINVTVNLTTDGGE